MELLAIHFTLKENIQEIDSKKCYEIVKYVKPKTFNFTHLNDGIYSTGF